MPRRAAATPDRITVELDSAPPWWERLRGWAAQPHLAPRPRREAALIALGLAILAYSIALWDLHAGHSPSWLSVGIRQLVIPLVGTLGAWLMLLPLVLGCWAVSRWPVAVPEEFDEEAEPSAPSLGQGAWAFSLILIVCILAFVGVGLRSSPYFLLRDDSLRVGWIGIGLSGWLIELVGMRMARPALMGITALALPLSTGLSWAQLWLAAKDGFQWMRTLAGINRLSRVPAELLDAEHEDDESPDAEVEAAVPVRGRRRHSPEPVDPATQAAVLDEIAGELEAEYAAEDDIDYDDVMSEAEAMEVEEEEEEGEDESEGSGRGFQVIDTNITPDFDHPSLGEDAFLDGEQQEIHFDPSAMDFPFELPPIRLLNDPPERQASTENFEGVKDQVEQALGRYGVTAYVDRITVGPSVTRVECIPEDGTRMAKLQGMEDDLQFDLAARSVRVEAPIPGRKAVGIELPNKVKHLVALKEIIASDAFQSAISPLTIALGKDLAGNAIVADLIRMPHLLIAGTTGAGKSVCLNAIIMSLLLRAHPSLVKMILIDPKKVELVPYNGLPHLLVPVVDDAKKALNALAWAEHEMDQRYTLLQKSQARNIDEYNTRHPRKPLPYIVIVIDELADLMALGAAELEKLINRLARLARAVGIHLVLATQRPDVKVITGQIKANIPTRIAFKVPSIVDSKTILDYSGAEKLLGFGDMLFKPQDGKPIRAQGCFVDEAEISKVAQFITIQRTPEYMEEILADREDPAAGAETGDDDLDEAGDDAEYYDEALQIALQTGYVSASMIQRKLRIGYNRASRLIDLLEKKGIISGPNGSRPRDVIRRDLYESWEEDEG